VFLASKARGELSLSLSHSGLTIAIPLELARAFYYLFDFTIAVQRYPFFLLHDKSLYKDEHESDTPFLIQDAQELAKD